MNTKTNFHISKQVNLSFFIQLTLLASLIIGSWINLQTQLNILQRDVSLLLQCQERITKKIELINEKTIAFEYRLRAIENQPQND